MPISSYMESDISIKSHQIAIVAVVCVVSVVGLTNCSYQASADTLKIKKPVVATDGDTEEKLVEVEGEVLIEAQDGSMLFQEMDGALRILTSAEVATKTIQDEPLPPMTKKQLGEALLEELPEGFKIHTTDDYVIAYQTGRAYAKWIGNLYQGPLNRGFKNFWSKRSFKLEVEKPKFPLVAVIFATRQQYAAHVQRELNSEVGSVIAYYNLHTNRVMMYDLTSDRHRGGGPAQTQRDIDKILLTQQGIWMVTTIIHEGTHQLMFNSGLQTRLADTPLWLNEGIAMYFEQPNLQARQGWKGPGRTNYLRLSVLRKNRTRAANSLETLISDDKRLQSDGQETVVAYAESWALVHFLINRKPTQFGQYLQFLSKKQPQQAPKPGQRLADFKKFFGDELLELDEEFIAYVNRLN